MGFLYGGRDNFEKAGGTIRGVYRLVTSANTQSYTKSLSLPVIYTLLHEYHSDVLKPSGGLLKGICTKTQSEFVSMKYKHHETQIDSVKLYGAIINTKSPVIIRDDFVRYFYVHYPYTGSVPEYIGLYGGILNKFEKVVS